MGAYRVRAAQRQAPEVELFTAFSVGCENGIMIPHLSGRVSGGNGALAQPGRLVRIASGGGRGKRFGAQGLGQIKAQGDAGHGGGGGI